MVRTLFVKKIDRDDDSVNGSGTYDDDGGVAEDGGVVEGCASMKSCLRGDAGSFDHSGDEQTRRRRMRRRRRRRVCTFACARACA